MSTSRGRKIKKALDTLDNWNKLNHMFWPERAAAMACMDFMETARVIRNNEASEAFKAFEFEMLEACLDNILYYGGFGAHPRARRRKKKAR